MPMVTAPRSCEAPALATVVAHRAPTRLASPGRALASWITSGTRCRAATGPAAGDRRHQRPTAAAHAFKRSERHQQCVAADADVVLAADVHRVQDVGDGDGVMGGELRKAGVGRGEKPAGACEIAGRELVAMRRKRGIHVLVLVTVLGVSSFHVLVLAAVVGAFWPARDEARA